MKYIIPITLIFGLNACVPDKAQPRDRNINSVAKNSEDSEPTSGIQDESTLDEIVDSNQIETEGVEAWEKEPPKNELKKDTRSDEAIMCEDGLKVANSKNLNNNTFDKLFKVLCDGDKISDTFNLILDNAYNGGEGEPKVHLVDSGTDEMYVTNMLFAYAIEVPLESPSQFAEMKIFERLDGQGIEHTNSKLTTDVLSREEFPGQGSVEEVNLEHRIQLAEGAALYDVRKTQINNYLFIESTRDITLSTEHLIEEDNEHYHIARGILVGLQNKKENTTYLIYVNEIVVKNRIDPYRLIKTVTNLSKSSQKLIYEQTLTIK